MSRPQRSLYWVGTINNPGDDAIGRILRLFPGDLTYLVIGRETALSGTQHLQCYVEFVSRKRLPSVRRLLGITGHYEIRRGSSSEASIYCKKDGDYREHGRLSTPAPGSRTDLEAIRQLIAGGATDLDIANRYFSRWIVYRRAFTAYRLLCFPPIFRPGLRVVVLWGLTGTGKSRLAYHAYPDLFTVPDAGLRWFDGYVNQSTCLLDDFRKCESNSFLLRVLDIYALQVPVKNGFCAWNPTKIIITSNFRPPFGIEKEAAQILRRIATTIHVRNVDFDDVDEVANLVAQIKL